MIVISSLLGRTERKTKNWFTEFVWRLETAERMLRHSSGTIPTCWEIGMWLKSLYFVCSHYHTHTPSHRYVGPYTHLNPDLSYVLEDSEGVCGYVLATLDSRTFYEQFGKEWLPTVIGSYPTSPVKTDEQRLATEEVCVCVCVYMYMYCMCVF